jgi:hypothetical protein
VALVLERRHRRGDPVVGEVGRDRDHREPGQAGRVLGHVERAPAADGHQRVVEAAAQPAGEAGRGGQIPVGHGKDLAVLECRAHRRGNLLALTGPDGDRHVSAARDPAVGEQRREPGHRAGADVDDQRRADHAR